MKPSLKTLSANIRTHEQAARDRDARATAMGIQAAAAIRRTIASLGDAAARGTRAKPTVKELNSIIDDLRRAL